MVRIRGGSGETEQIVSYIYIELEVNQKTEEESQFRHRWLSYYGQMTQDTAEGEVGNDYFAIATPVQV